MVVGDGVLVGLPFDVEAALGDLAIGGVGAGTTASRLLVEMLFADGASDLEVAADGVSVENRLDLEIDFRGTPQPRLGPGEAIAELLKLFTGGGDVAAPAGFLAQGQEGAPDPDD